MKYSKLIIAMLVLVVIAGVNLSAHSEQEEPTATDAQKKVITTCKCSAIIKDICASKDEISLRGLIENSFAQPCAYENYEKLVADAKAALADPACGNKDYINYTIAKARIEQLSVLAKNNDIETGRLYMAVNDKYFTEAMECLDKVASTTKSKSLVIDNNMLRFVVFKERLQAQKTDAAFDAIAAQIANYSEDGMANKKELEYVAGKLKNLGLSKDSVKLRILYASKSSPEIGREVLEEIRSSAEKYFDQNDLKEAANLYEQYVAAAPAYYNKEEMGAKIMDTGEKYFKAGKYREAKKYYMVYMEKYSDLPPADYCSYKLALSSYYMKDHIRTISQLEDFLEKYKNSAWFDKAFEMLAKVYYENLPRDKAIESLQSLIDRYYRKDTGDYARILIAMLYYRAKNYDTTEDKLKIIEATSSYSYTAKMITDDIKEIRNNKIAPTFGTDATDAYSIWDPYKGIDVKIAPMMVGPMGDKQEIKIENQAGASTIEVPKGARVQLTLQGLVDEDKFNEYTIDKDDQSRLPKMIKEETEKDLLSIHWAVDGGNFTDDKETDVKIWKAPNEPGTYKITVKIDDLGLVRVPNKGTRKDSTTDSSLIVIIK